MAIINKQNKLIMHKTNSLIHIANQFCDKKMENTQNLPSALNPNFYDLNYDYSHLPCSLEDIYKMVTNKKTQH